MSTAFADIEKLAFGLSEQQRIQLASSLLRSIPSPGWDDDDGINEALRRKQELKERPELTISHDEFLSFFENRKQK